VARKRPTSTSKRIALVRRRGLRTLRRALGRASVVLGIARNFRRIRAANDPRA